MVVGVNVATQRRPLAIGNWRFELLDDAPTLSLPFPHSVPHTVGVVWPERFSNIYILLLELAALAFHLRRHGSSVGMVDRSMAGREVSSQEDICQADCLYL
jgi:hypothetical protein